MRSQRSKNFSYQTRAKERAVEIERAFFHDLIWLAFLVAIAIFFFPFASQAGDYQAHIAKLGKLEVQMQKIEDEIHEQAQKKSHAQTAAEKESATKEMIASYQELQKTNQEYSEIKTHIRFKHPEKGDEAQRRYTYEVKPLSSFENDSTLDGKLDSFLGKFHSVYGEPKKAEAKKEPPKAVAVQTPKKVVDPDDVNQPLTLSK